MQDQTVLFEEITIVVAIKDGYQNGDKLSLDSSFQAQSRWDDSSKLLTVIFNTENAHTKEIIDAVGLLGNKAGAERFITAEMVNTDGSISNLVEYGLLPSNEEIMNTSFDDVFLDLQTDDTELEANFDTIVYDVSGVDFFNADITEQLPYYLNKSSDQGDIYTILKDSFVENNEVEIWGYNLASDKIDLNNLSEDIRAVNYQISNNDLQLQVYNDNAEYNIIFRDVSYDTASDNIDDILQNLVVNIPNDKV